MFKKKPHPPQSQAQSPPKISVKTDFPTGIAVRTENGVYFIKGATRFKFFSERVFSTWSLVPVDADYSAVKHFQPGGSHLGFRDGTLINNLANGRIYLVSGNKKRHVVDPDAFDKYGLDKSRVVVVSDEEAALHSDGEALK